MHEGYVNNVLSAISVNDIEKVTVLKNATALYGAKGANGVVVIETKRAKSMATRIDVDIYGAMELMPKLPTMMNADQYRLYASDVMVTSPRLRIFWTIILKTARNTPLIIIIRIGKIMCTGKLLHKTME